MSALVMAKEWGEVCRVVVGELPKTGASLSPLAALGVAVLLLTVSGAVLWATRRGQSLTVAAVLVAGLVVVGTLTVSPSALAAEADVEYSEGCGLVAVVEAEFSDALKEGLLPGDDVVVVEALVVNRYDSAVDVSLAPELEAPLADVAQGSAVRVDTEDETFVLAAGQKARVALSVRLPLDAGDDAQEQSGDVSLVITAVAQNA